ncbi:MAG TPA: fibrillarin-like rRNA/tRNA 2'-O-methyltransferase [Nanoarchaeota archaeon]|nr:fibrillarin-like rRNA/tRNA 2'-O-methyltransferase [Nanoarchaeota archaeon]
MASGLFAAREKISKLKAILDLGFKAPIKETDMVLYLGASHGVTALLVSGMAGENGFVFCVEMSKDSMKYLLKVCETRANMAPLLFDASLPLQYKGLVAKCDVIYMDIAQKSQADILKKNADMFLKKGGTIIFIVKTQSIDTVKAPLLFLEDLKKQLSWMEIDFIADLDKTHAKHYAVIGKKK